MNIASDPTCRFSSQSTCNAAPTCRWESGACKRIACGASAQYSRYPCNAACATCNGPSSSDCTSITPRPAPASAGSGSSAAIAAGAAVGAIVFIAFVVLAVLYRRRRRALATRTKKSALPEVNTLRGRDGGTIIQNPIYSELSAAAAANAATALDGDVEAYAGFKSVTGEDSYEYLNARADHSTEPTYGMALAGGADTYALATGGEASYALAHASGENEYEYLKERENPYALAASSGADYLGEAKYALVPSEGDYMALDALQAENAYALANSDGLGSNYALANAESDYGGINNSYALAMAESQYGSAGNNYALANADAYADMGAGGPGESRYALASSDTDTYMELGQFAASHVPEHDTYMDLKSLQRPTDGLYDEADAPPEHDTYMALDSVKAQVYDMADDAPEHDTYMTLNHSQKPARVQAWGDPAADPAMIVQQPEATYMVLDAFGFGDSDDVRDVDLKNSSGNDVDELESAFA